MLVISAAMVLLVLALKYADKKIQLHSSEIAFCIFFRISPLPIF
ncbi:hypothetical protein AM1_4830 [Acaryochloris marina MBIC11017]|uniref:Uncharacterized protein n=1 Tax=Acaryochloris marina (strain MBIC 11017) TaxID=329726 RepID=B0C3G7_ACAM1|nr:hypothetical protein AM1_4830 [Acaryochloris marina MBIC11017]